MHVDLEVVNLSWLQFGATALSHFLFVPLTLGLSWLLRGTAPAPSERPCAIASG